MVGFSHTLPGRWCRGRHVAGRMADFAGAPGLIGCVFNAHDGGEPEYRELQQSSSSYVTRHFGLYAISFAIAGTASYQTDAGTYQLRPGMVYQYHDVRQDDRERIQPDADGFLDCSLFLRGRFIRDLLRLGIWDPELQCEASGGGADVVAAYVDLFHVLLDERLPSAAVLRLAIAHIERVYARIRDTRPTDDLVTRACRLLAAHPEPQFRVAQAARDLGVSYRELRRRFRSQMGMSLIDFQVQQRMRMASSLLRELSVHATAERLGYDDPYLFSRQFKRVHGVAPSYFHSGTSAS